MILNCLITGVVTIIRIPRFIVTMLMKFGKFVANATI